MMSWTESGAPMPSTTCSSWVRKSAPTAVATTLPMPPASDVPPSTTAAIVGQQVVVAGADARRAEEPGDQDPRAAVGEARDDVGRRAVAAHADTGGVRRRRARADRDEPAPEHGRPHHRGHDGHGDRSR